jgi:hypothetical protein
MLRASEKNRKSLLTLTRRAHYTVTTAASQRRLGGGAHRGSVVTTRALGSNRQHHMEAEVVMLRRGDIAIERLTGRRAMVIDFTGPEEVTCRFNDGRLEDRFLFELDIPRPTVWDSVWSLLKSPFVGEVVKKRPPAPAATAAPRPPRLARQATAGTTSS